MKANQRKKTGLWILLTVIVAGLIVGGIVWGTSNRDEKILQKYALALNLNCPRDIEPGMSLKRVVTLPDNTLVYNITSEVITRDIIEKDSLIDSQKLSASAREKVIQALQNDPNLPTIRHLGITFIYRYIFPDGSSFMTFTITPEDYR